MHFIRADSQPYVILLKFCARPSQNSARNMPKIVFAIESVEENVMKRQQPHLASFDRMYRRGRQSGRLPAWLYSFEINHPWAVSTCRHWCRRCKRAWLKGRMTYLERLPFAIHSHGTFYVFVDFLPIEDDPTWRCASFLSLVIRTVCSINSVYFITA